MRTHVKLMTLLICGSIITLTLAGCSKDDDGPPATDVTGAWITTTWISVYVPGNNVKVTWNLSQTGSAIYGSFSDNLGNGGGVEGSISDYTVFLTFRYAHDETHIVYYEATADATTMSGTFRGEGEVKLGDARLQLPTQ